MPKSSSSRFILIALAFVAVAAIVVTTFVIPTNTVEGVLLLGRDFVRLEGTGHYAVVDQQPEALAPVFIVSKSRDRLRDIAAIKRYRSARLQYQIATAEVRLGRRMKVQDSLKYQRNHADTLAYVAYLSLTSDPSTIALRTDIEGRFSAKVPAGSYFILARSPRNILLTLMEVQGELDYDDDVSVIAFQTHRHEFVWTPHDIQ